MKSSKPSMEFSSAIPEEVRYDLDLPSDASQGEVIARRRMLFDLSCAEIELESGKVDQNA